MIHPARKQGQFCFADYQRWPDFERWQLLHGQAHAMAPPSWAHQSVVFELARQLGNALLGHRCQARSGPVGVRLPYQDEADDAVRTVFEPDLLIVCDPAKIDARGVRGAPDVVLEVLSPSTASFDQVDKRLAYERAGVRELWLIDVAGGVAIIYRLEGSRFGAADIVHARGRLDVAAVAGLTLDLDFIDGLRAAAQ